MLAVGALLLANSIQLDPITADFFEKSAVILGDETQVRISWVDDRLDRGARQTRVVTIPSAYLTGPTIQIWLDSARPDSQPVFEDPSLHLTAWEALMTTALIGLALGFVVLGSLAWLRLRQGRQGRGYTVTQLREDRGFYWRS